MRLTSNHFKQLGLESLTDIPAPVTAQPGYANQPTVPVYLPEEDGSTGIIQRLNQYGIQTKPCQWEIQPGMEAKEALLTTLLRQQQEKIQEEKEEDESFSDYSLYALAPNTKPYLYERLEGAEKELVVLTQPVEEYPSVMLEHLSERVPVDNIYTELDTLVHRLRK